MEGIKCQEVCYLCRSENQYVMVKVYLKPQSKTMSLGPRAIFCNINSTDPLNGTETLTPETGDSEDL